SVSILFYLILWGFVKLRDQLKDKKLEVREVSSLMDVKTANLIGLRKPSLRDSLFIIICLFVGIIINFFVLLILVRLGVGTLYYVINPTLYTYVSNLLVPPIFEELIYRGIYLGVFIKIFGNSPKYAVVGLVMSSFTFTRIHPFAWNHPSEPLVKLIGGFLLGSVYLIRWKKNLAASMATHLGLNLVGTFFILVP
ncbi:MAG: CPBP family intramembrane glutamic endopeptidase, partial [Nitrososphaerota archaeon]